MGASGEMSIPSVFQAFIAAARAAFDYLIASYGFQLKAERAVGSEAWVTYENETTRITVHYELGAEPWVEIGRLELRSGQIVQPSSIGLDLLLRERGEPLSDAVDVPREIGDSELSRMIAVRAEGLRAFGDLLSGDFRSFPKLQTKAEKELQKREVELFGKQ
jgi:hypothetical protein